MSDAGFNETKLFNISFDQESSSSVTISRSTQLLLTILNVLFASVGSVGNILVVLVIGRSSCLREIPDFFICSLALADFIVTSIRQPLMVYDLHNVHAVINKDMVIEAFRTIAYIPTPCSLTCMLTVTFDRFIAIKYPFRYDTVMTKKRAFLSIAICWALSIVIAVAFYVWLDAMRYVMWTFIVITLIVTVTIYIYLFLIARKHQNNIDNTTNLPQNDTSPQQKQDRKSSYTIALVVGVFTSFYMPFLVYPLAVNPKAIHFYNGFFWVHSVCLWNSSINPFIYCFRSSRYRAELKQLLRFRNTIDIAPVARNICVVESTHNNILD